MNPFPYISVLFFCIPVGIFIFILILFLIITSWSMEDCKFWSSDRYWLFSQALMYHSLCVMLDKSLKWSQCARYLQWLTVKPHQPNNNLEKHKKFILKIVEKFYYNCFHSTQGSTALNSLTRVLFFPLISDMRNNYCLNWCNFPNSTMNREVSYILWFLSVFFRFRPLSLVRFLLPVEQVEVKKVNRSIFAIMEIKYISEKNALKLSIKWISRVNDTRRN